MTIRNYTDEEPAEDRPYRWEVEPHPYDSGFDVFVTDSDRAAQEAIKYAAEMYLWDGIKSAGERTLTVRFNEEVQEKGDQK